MDTAVIWAVKDTKKWKTILKIKGHNLAKETKPIQQKQNATKPSPNDEVPGILVREVFKELRGHPLQCEVDCQRRFCKESGT